MKEEKRITLLNSLKEIEKSPKLSQELHYTIGDNIKVLRNLVEILEKTIAVIFKAKDEVLKIFVYTDGSIKFIFQSLHITSYVVDELIFKNEREFDIFLQRLDTEKLKKIEFFLKIKNIALI